MVGLIIALCLLPVRRTSGQSTVVSILGLKTVPLQVETSSVPRLSTAPEQQPPLLTNIQTEPQVETSSVPKLSTNPEQPQLLTNIQTENHGDLPSPIVGDQPQQVFVSHATPESMSEASRDKSANMNETRNGNVTDKIVFIEDDEENRVTPCSKPPAPPRHEATTNGPTHITPSTPIIVNGTQVELDERSSFDGDQCPTGYVRVNGKCVEKD